VLYEREEGVRGGASWIKTTLPRPWCRVVCYLEHLEQRVLKNEGQLIPKYCLFFFPLWVNAGSATLG